MYKHLQSLLVLFILSLSFGKLNAQTCDENIRKALEQTRITTFAQVTQGATGEFVIRYPLAGTKYTLRDQGGNAYTYTYTGTPVQIAITIPVGAVTTARSFSFTAENGSCSYSSGFDYTITPQTTTGLSVRVENEWCNDAGGIYFKMIGANTTDYDFYLKNNSDTNYDFSPTKRLAYSGAQTLKAGTYDLMAVLKTDNTKKVERTGIKVEMLVEPIVFTAEYIPSVCAGQQASVKVNVTSGKYPLYFTLYDKTFNTIIKPKQTSNVFTNVPKGEYRVLVENFCAVGGGAQRPQPVVVDDYFFSLDKIESAWVFEHACNYASFREISFTSENAKYIWEKDAFPYPFTIKLKFTSPTSQVYTVSKTISNRTDLEDILRISNGSSNKTLYWKEDIYQNVPLEYGNWTVEAQLIACGNTKTLPTLTKKLLDPMESVKTRLSTDATCYPNKILVGMKNIGENREYPVYIVLEKYPNTFNPDAEGFYKIATSNPLLANKYLKKYQTLINDYDLIRAGNLRAGDEFQFRAVSVDCNKNRLLDKVIIPTSTTKTSYTYFWQTASCKSTPTGSKFANLIIANTQYNNNIREVKLLAFSGDNSLLPVTLPYTFTRRNTSGIQQEWQINDMPVGNYTYQYSDICGNTYTATKELIEDKYTITWEEGCTPKVKGVLQSTPKYRTYYFVERLDEVTGQWVTAASNGNPLPILGNHGNSEAVVTTNTQGKFRVIRKIVNANGMSDCIQVVSEKEYKGDLRQPKVITFRCSVGGKHHIALAPQGGTPPYTYELVSQQKTGQANPTILNKAGDDENFFLNIDGSDINTRYVFKVTDACNRAETVDWIVSNYQPLRIEADKTTYCDGQRAVLSVPYLGSKITIKWYREDNLTTPLHTGATYTITNLVSADFNNKYIVKLETTHETDVNTCLMANTSEYQFVRPANAPTPTAVQKHDTVKCLSNDPVDNATYPAMFDLNGLFTDNNSNPLYIKKITDKSGVITVPTNGKVNINTSVFVGKTNTFVYTIASTCGNVLTSVEATLKVMKPLTLQGLVPNINLCQATATYKDIEDLMFRIYGNGYNQIRNSGATFEWYESQTDAEAETNKKIVTTSIGAIAEGSSKNLYLRLTKEGYCSSSVNTIKVNKVATTAPSAKTLGNVCALTVWELKKMIDAVPSQIIIYQGGRALDNNHHLLNTTGITYSKKLGECETAQAAVTFSMSGGQTQGQPQNLTMCTFLNNANGLSYVLGAEVRNALKALYPNAEANGIKIYNSSIGSEYRDTDFVNVSNRNTFTVKENNKCVSDFYTFSIVEKERTPINSVSVSICEDATTADIKTKITGNNKKIFKDNVEQTDAMPIDWDMANKYSYSLTNSGKCESVRASITLTKSNDSSPISPKAVNLCGGVAQTIATIKAQLGDSSAKVYLKNGNNYDEQADNATVNTARTYYYTVKAAGKCISEKAPIAITIAQPTPTPQGPNSTTGCIKTVGDLSSYIRAQDPTRNTEALAIYAGLLDTNKGTALADSTTLTQTTYSYAYTEAGKCESAIRHITISRVATPTVTQTVHTLCGGGSQTIASLQPQGTNIVWYNSATGGSPLASTTPLVAGTTYYVAQKNGTCESERVAVAVTQGASGNETLAFSTPFSKTLKCVPSGQLRFQVQNAVAGQSYVVELTQVPAGYTGSRTFTITKDNKEGNVPFVWLTQNNIPKGTYKARLVKCGVSQEIGQTITELTSNFPIRDNFDAGPYVDINDCNYVNLRNSQARAGGIDINAYFQNEAIAKQFFEYTAVSPQDMTDKGWTSVSQIPNSYWREVYSLPAGITSSQPKVIYYDLAAFGRNYADLAIANRQPKFYFRLKGQSSCGVSTPIEFGDPRMLKIKMSYGGSCTAPTIKISFENTIIICKPVTYEVKNQAGQVVASGTFNVVNGGNVDITNLNGNPINPNEKYSVTVKAAAPDTQSATTEARSFNQAKAAYRADGQYAEIKRCFGHPERTEMYIQGFLRDNGVLLSLKGYKVTLESAPAGYANEPNKLKVGESYTITRDDTSYNLLSTLNAQNTTGFSSLPEGDYKIKIEDPCGQTYYVENGRRKKVDILTIEHPQYSEKPLTPEKEVACTGVKVYPFKGNTAQDWLKKNNQNQNLYVWLVKIPAGVNAADISTTPQQATVFQGKTYQRALYSRDNAATLNTYFTLPRNENSTGLYTFAYAEYEREIYNYIANSPTACVRTFTISVDDVLLNIDRSTYAGYKCEGGTGKIVVKAVNGINDANNYTYELYATKTGTVIETKTAAKGTTVTFTNLGTFSTGQNTRWLKLTDASCPTQSMWRELPIDILEKPASGNTYTFCAAATVAELKAKVATDTATVRVYKNGTLVTNNNEVLSATATYTVSRFNASCETDKVAVTVTISNTVSLTVPTALTVTCTAANIDTTVNNWLGQATVTDTCGTATLTHDFAAVKPTNWCNTSVVTVTFVGKDPQGNTVTKTSVIKVNSTPIVANDDTHTITNGLTGGITSSVLTNDSLNGNNNPSTSSVTLTWLTVPSGLQTNTDGTIRVPAGTASGTYTVTYRICEKLNSSNCDTATLTIKVGSAPIVAKDDTYTVTNGLTGGTTPSVLTNDSLNGNNNPSTSSVTLTWLTVPSGLQTNTDGTIRVPAGTASGTYIVTYRICEKLNSSNCDTATLTITVLTPAVVTPTTIEANDDVATVSSTTGGTTSSVLTNDKLNGVPNPSVSSVTLTWTTATPTGFTLNPNGTITVAPNTPAGTYTISYKICAVASLTVCDTADIVVTVTGTTTSTTTPTTIEANDDVATVSSTTGGTTSSVLTNDKLNGVPNPSVSSVTLTWTTATPTGFTLNPNGTITVAPNTPAGTYTISYKICAVASLTVCDTADIVVTVTGTTTSTTTPTTIEANDDVATVSSTTGGTTSSVLTNDKLNGVPNPSVSSVTLTWNTATPTGFTLNPNGTITVAPNTPAGTYTISYKICAVASSTVCDNANIVVTVTGTTTSTTTPTTIEANDDVATVSSTTGGTTSSVLTNDKLNGVPNPSVSSVTLTWTTATPTGFTLNPNGTITVAPNTPAGTYTISYKICAVASSTVCDTADIVVTVTGTTTSTTTPTTIEANDDVATITSTTGGTTSSVLTNDKLNGVSNPSVSSVTLTWNTATPTGFTLNPNGTITVAPNTPAGTYTISYKICAVASSTVCDNANIVVTVTGTTTSTTTPTTIEANDDVATVSSTTGGTTSSVLTNDKLNGVPNPSVSSVTLTWNTATPTGFTLNPNGTITIAPNTPAGTYTISYKICAVASSTVCDNANIVVTVTGTTTSTTTPTTIEANDDVATVSSTTGGTTSSVLTNDKLNGVPNPSVSSVTLTWNTATPTGFTLNPHGTITIAPNTPAGTYTISYKICAVASSTVCDTADIVVTVTGTTTSTTTPTTIEANDDVATVSSTTGGTTSSVLTNDKLNGVPNPSISSVTLTWNTATPTGFTLNPNGTITVAPNTPAGTYTISYKICAVASSTVCDNANIVVTVTGTTTSTTTPTTIEANDDVATVSSTTGGTTPSVLTNDKLNGVLNPSVSSVTLTWNTATPTGFTLNPNGTITVAPNTPASTYTISYKICAVASSTVCDNANIVVTVTGTTTSTTTPTTIEANDDVATVSSTTGGTTSSVLTNDKLNGVPNPSVSSVTLTWTTATPTGFTLNPNGTITVAPNTPAGTYTISYKICAVASTTVCDTANIVVTVTGTTTSTTPVLPIAADDRTTTPIDTPVVVNVLANDTPNGATAPNVVTNPTNGTTVVNSDGTIEYRPHTGFEGIDTFVYELCNTDGCASATVTIEVISKLIPYNGMSVDDDGKNEHFHIGGINRYPDNVVRIYNRWGVKVFEAEGYNNVTRVFRGFSNGRVVVETSDKLPQGTYYYVIEYVDENKQKRSEVGWLYLKR
ncbi:Ig-like domain-containing protein [Capnocytophaga leadbetteri]